MGSSDQLGRSCSVDCRQWLLLGRDATTTFVRGSRESTWSNWKSTRAYGDQPKPRIGTTAGGVFDMKVSAGNTNVEDAGCCSAFG